MNVLGIDYGTKHIGLAWVQVGLDVVLPFGVVETGNWKKEIGKLVKEEKIDKIVVGLPFGLEGEENENTKRIRLFAKELEDVVNIPIEYIDESFTTHEAHSMGGGASADEKAAMLILQSYLNKD